MDKILDLFLKTPLAKRLTTGLVERGIILVVGLIAGWLQLPTEAYQGDLVKFASEVAPEAAMVLLLAIVAVKRIKKTEMTIAVAQANSPFVSRAEIDRQVKDLSKPATAETRTPVKP